MKATFIQNQENIALKQQLKELKKCWKKRAVKNCKECLRFKEGCGQDVEID